MKSKILVILIFMCVSCGEVANVSTLKLDYPEKAIIEWDNIFEQIEDQYSVYFYSRNCGYCINFQSSILFYYYTNKIDLYFCDVTNGYNRIKNMDVVLNCGNIGNFGISGTPLLIEIKNHVVINYFLGINSINLFFNNK